MSTKSHIPLILNELKKYYGFKTNIEFAKFLGIAPTTLSSWYSRESVDYELLYSKCVDVNANWLLTGEGPMLKEQKESKEVIVTTNKSDEKALPLLPVSAIARFGSGELQVKEMDIEQWYTLPDFPSADFLITISGDSMLPTYKPGDIAICKRITNIYNIVWGRLYVIYSNDMGALFKRIYPTDNTDYLILRSDNAESYPDIRILKTDIINISLVLGIIRKD